MATARAIVETSLSPERVLAAAYDFSERRERIFPAVSSRRLQVHELDETSADVTEGTRAGPIVNWERCRYEWSQPGSVTATVTDSNVYAVPGSLWEIRASAKEDGGSRVEMVWTREFRSGPRGAFFGFFFGRLGDRIFGKYARDMLANLEILEAGRA